MIVSFGSKETEKIWNGIRIRKPSIELQEITRRKLRMLNNSVDLYDLKIPPSNRLEKLVGNMNDFYSIIVNNQWRIIFKWNRGTATYVELIDYH